MTKKAKSAHLDVDTTKYQELIAAPYLSKYLSTPCLIRILIYNRYSELDLVEYWNAERREWMEAYTLWSHDYEIPNGQEWDREVLVRCYKPRVDELMKIAGVVLEVETEVER